ncbi:MAG: hypothetical protein QXX55_01835 [Candidatus Pacearchaeota archaeon]
MKLLGFGFTKINIEKFENQKNPEEIKINTDINILEIKKLDQKDIKTEEDVIAITFSYKVGYSPNFAEIELKGKMIISGESKEIKDLLNEWKNKEIFGDAKLFIFNIILKRSTVRALQFEEELGLPFHIPLPFFNKGNKEKK